MRRALAVHRLFSQTGAGWVPLLEIIVRECPVASVIEVNTAGMQALAERMLQEVGRQDVTVTLRPPRVASIPPAPRS
jgi:hypothetical protein